jgi:predicted RNA binding protein YcfA (HicA-like mRNA interferase family)
MSKRDKLRQKLRNRPADGTMRDVETLLGQFGFSLARIRGSHHIFEYDQGGTVVQLVVPMHGRKVKKVYIQLVIEKLDALFPVEDLEAENETEESDD